MSEDYRHLYVATNPAMPGLVKIGMSSAGAKSRVEGLGSSSSLPAAFHLIDYVAIPPEVPLGELRDLEREVHRRLDGCRYSENREFFRVHPDKALDVIREVKQDALRFRSQGLTATGKPRQPTLPDTPRGTSRADRHRARRRVAEEDRKARRHWHVWLQPEGKQTEESLVTALNRDRKTYWSKSGAASRVKRERHREAHAEFILCSDVACPAYGKRRSETYAKV